VAWQQQQQPRACCFPLQHDPTQHVYSSGRRDQPAAHRRAQMQSAQHCSAYPPSTAAAHTCVTGSRVWPAAACTCTDCGAASSDTAAVLHAATSCQHGAAEGAAIRGVAGCGNCKLGSGQATEPRRRHVHESSTAEQRLLVGQGSSVAAAAGAAAPHLAAGVVLHTSAPQMLP
jgi:hypothetical protein